MCVCVCVRACVRACVCVLPFWLLSVAVGVLSFLLSSPSLSFYAPLCWILFSWAVEILTLCSQTPHPVTILSSLSSTSPLSGSFEKSRAGSPLPRAHTQTHSPGSVCRALHAWLPRWRLTGFLGFYPSLLRLSIFLLSSLLLSSPLSFSPPVTPSAARLRSAISSCNPALQKAVIEQEIHAGIIAVIWGRW